MYSSMGGKGFFFAGLEDVLRLDCLLGLFFVSSLFLWVFSHEVVLVVVQSFHLLELAGMLGGGVNSGSIFVEGFLWSFFVQGSCLVQGSEASSVIPNLVGLLVSVKWVGMNSTGYRWYW